MNPLSERFGKWLSHWLSQPNDAYSASLPTPQEQLASTLQPCDVLLVEGKSRISQAIKYLTQSTWSHAALYVGNRGDVTGHSPHGFVEADISEGIRRVSLEEYAGFHCRICRPVGLDEESRNAVIDYALSRVGQHYDLRNVFDLLRYLFPTPPVPQRWRRHMLMLGSGDPTRAICSTLLAQCFQRVRYPILPIVERRLAEGADCPDCIDEFLRLRHHSLFVPRDFDVSPYFQIIKPTLERGFAFRQLKWVDQSVTGSSVQADQ